MLSPKQDEIASLTTTNVVLMCPPLRRFNGQQVRPMMVWIGYKKRLVKLVRRRCAGRDSTRPTRATAVDNPTRGRQGERKNDTYKTVPHCCYIYLLAPLPPQTCSRLWTLLSPMGLSASQLFLLRLLSSGVSFINRCLLLVLTSQPPSRTCRAGSTPVPCKRASPSAVNTRITQNDNDKG